MLLVVMMLSMLHLTEEKKIVAWKFDAGIVHAIGA